MRRWALLALLVATMEADAEDVGLSKGPTNPTDLGTRCAVMAGRDDRAYLHCAEQLRRPATGEEAGALLPDRPRIGHPARGHEGVGGRYAPRRP